MGVEANFKYSGHAVPQKAVEKYCGKFLKVCNFRLQNKAFFSRVCTVKALIKEPLKNNYDPQRRLVRSEKKNYFEPWGARFREAPSN